MEVNEGNQSISVVFKGQDENESTPSGTANENDDKLTSLPEVSDYMTFLTKVILVSQLFVFNAS